MKLSKIKIENFKSIDSLSFEIEPVADSYTYTLLGINESGKSSFLKAISLFDEKDIIYPTDYFNELKIVDLFLYYKLGGEELKAIKEILAKEYSFDKNILNEVEIEEVIINVYYGAAVSKEKTILESLEFKKKIFTDYTLVEKEGKKIVQKKNKGEAEQADFDLENFFEIEFKDYFWDISHKVVFWKSSPEYLIVDEIDLALFATDPKKVSIPLANCFKIAGLKNIKNEISKLSSPVSIQNLEDLLSDKITTHINQVWPEHPIRIKFKINNNKLTFLIEDKDVKYQIKTTGQRSDGFRQFISFLLTLSAENYTEELSNSILLLDEPETHLHPSAQLNLTAELIKISQNSKNNIVFFATHSNYMIDKENIDRCYKVIKRKNSTVFERIRKSNTSYAEANYEIFDVVTNDYHNELYGYLEDVDKVKLNAIEKSKKWINEKSKKTEDVSLPTYIRHSIHHPENTSNKPFTLSELKKSIQLLRGMKSELK